ncbi:MULTISPECIES: FecR domain-containing protein [unclassified Halobacteriovorax]|uniref:FecR family protein n=1 Tax=unclassified Halobacteriovorax TaxID=2639665 RepID=UPI000EA40AD5|nr:FecR family protein [Halobacteriovorax sp. BALOs_7]AYF44256.1 sigma factor regulatory protein, FecR/PupR family [Halobacteriovorax sp. BALOs_7]
MKLLKQFIIFQIALVLNLSILNAAGDKGVAKVMKKRGKVFITQTKKKLKKGDWVPEGASITTKSRSFVKLLFIDKSNLTLGANSQMEIKQFPKKKAGIINLVNGQLRSKVSKNYLQIDKKKSKLFIKTKTAAMGVRGTDFQVNYNSKNQNTTLITFEGAVAMGSLSKFKVSDFRQDRLEKVVSSPTSVMVKRGQLSGVMPAIDSKPIAPVKINKKQLKALENNDGSKMTNAKDKKNKKAKPMARNIIPPGVDSKSFSASTNTEVADQMAKVDSSIRGPASEAKKKKKIQISQDTPKGSLKDGGYVDTENALYIPPPKNAAMDPMTNEVIVPVQMGSFDKETGMYTNDYYEVDESGNFIEKEDDSLTRLPASTSTMDTTNSDMKEVTNVYDVMDEQMDDTMKMDDTTISLTDPNRTTASTEEDKMMEDTMSDRDDMIETTKDPLSSTNRAVIRVILEKQP